jgi:SAM-dependent methyltransferase
VSSSCGRHGVGDRDLRAPHRPLRDAVRLLLPAPAFNFARSVYCVLADVVDRMSGKRDALTPPRRLDWDPDGRFDRVGEEFLSHFVELGGLKPVHRVLDVGCGAGRMARPLTGYLDSSGRYDGFDMLRRKVRWCQTHIGRRHPNFTFKWVDLINREYAPAGRIDPAQFVFPYPDGEFDFVFLTSVFTHMLPTEVEHYLAEIARVLKPGGRCFATFFLLNPESRRLSAKGGALFSFEHPLPGCATIDEVVPEKAVAHDEALIMSLFHESGMRVLEPVRYGRWCGRLEGPTAQDIVVAERSKTPERVH